MALSNEFKVLTWIANRGLAELLINLPWIQCGTTEYDGELDNRVYAKGDTLQVRRANRRIGGEGPVINLDGIIEKTEPLTIEKQFNDGLMWTTVEQALFQSGDRGMEIYAERYIKPSILRLVTKVHQYIGERAVQDIYYSYGTPGTPINSPGQIAKIHARMENLSIPVGEEKYLIVNPIDGAELKTSLVNFFNPTFNKGIGEKYFLKEIMDFQYQATSGIKRHIAGAGKTGYTLTIKSDVTSGNTIVITGFGGVVVGAIKKGDIIEVTNPVIVAQTSYERTNIPAQFVAQADADSDAAGDVSVTVSPEVVTALDNPFRNVYPKLTAGDPVTVYDDHNVNTVFTKGALSYACPKMKDMWTGGGSVSVTDKDFGTGITLRLSRGADIVNDQNIMRWDILCGARFWGEYCTRAVS